MRKVLRGASLGLLLLGMLFVLAACLALATEDTRFQWKNRDARYDGLDEARQLDTAEGVVALLAREPRRFSAAGWAIDDPDGGVFIDADRVRPVAAVTKLVVASALAHAFAAGVKTPEQRVDLDTVDAFHFRDADMRAHQTAIGQLNITTGFTLDQLVQATLRWGDPAAADALMMELGRPALEAEVQRLGIEGLFAPAPYCGDLVRLLEAGVPGTRVDVDQSWALAKRLKKDPAWARRVRLRVEETGMPAYRLLRAHRVASSHRGTARGYAKLMERVATDPGAWGATMRRWVSWPMGFEFVEAEWDHYGTKAGSAVSIFSTVSYAQPRDGGMAVVAMFIEDLPIRAWLTLDQTYNHDDIEHGLLRDRAYRDQIRALFAGDGGAP